MRNLYSPIKSKDRIIAAIILLAILCVGLLTFKDYGFTWDEEIQRQHSIINYQYVVKQLTGRELSLAPQNLETYTHRFYGVALQLPMVLYEHMKHFQLPLREVFVARHLFTFCICYIGYVCFYLFCRKVFKSRWFAILSVLMLAIYPRFWGEQFTNIKDMVFMATCCASMLGISLCIENDKTWKYEILAAFFFALSANTRIIGAMFPFTLFGYRILRDICLNKASIPPLRMKTLWLNTGRYFLQLLLTLAFFYIITPAAWNQPVQHIANTFATFSDYKAWDHWVPFLGGPYRGNNLPWFYIPAWLGISLPLWYLVLLLASLPIVIDKIIKAKNSVICVLTDYKYYALCFLIASCPMILVLFMKVTMYSAWRHTYYIMPSLVLMMLYTVKSIWSVISKKRFLRTAFCTALSILIASECCFSIRNHPFEKVYLNPIGKLVSSQVELDYWYESFNTQFQWLISHDNSNAIKISYGSYPTAYIDPAILARIKAPADAADAEYILLIINNNNDPLAKVGDDYVTLHTIYVDGMAISTLYVRKDIFLERYNGVLPTD